MKNERLTRKEIIDLRLREAGWDVGDRTQVVLEFDINVSLPHGVDEPQAPYQGHQFSDYVLLGKNGKSLAVIEAKKLLLMPKLAENKQSNIVITFKEKQENSLFVFIQMGMKFTFGI